MGKFNEWVRRYESRTEPYGLEPGFTLYFEPDNGFLTYAVLGDCLVLDHTCCERMDWAHAIAKRLATENRCHFIVTQTMRNPAAFCRHSHGHLDIEKSGYRKNGIWYWVFEERI